METITAAASIVSHLAAMTVRFSSVLSGAPAVPEPQPVDTAVWFLLGMTGFVQAGFVAMFLAFWLRARQLRRRREQFHVIAGGFR